VRRARGACGIVAALLAIAIAAPARGDVEIKFGGQISSDIRYRLGGEEVPPGLSAVPFPSQQRLLKYGFSRNENLIKAQLSLTIGERVKAVADVDFVWYGYSDVNELQAETLHERVDPYRLEAHAAYIDVYKILPHVDLRIGRQVVAWGTADRFNPTSNLNSLDLSDPVLFGKPLANDMIRLDWNPWRDLIVTAVWVPIFRPAQLPRTAPLALTDPARPAPVQEDGIRLRLGQLALANPPTAVNAYTMLPEPSIENTQVGVRIAGRLLKQDVSLSYYHGRFGIPSPSFTVNGPKGVVSALVMWPRMDVLGADIAGSIDKLGGLGYFAEVGVFFPQEITYGIYNDGTGTITGHDPVTFVKQMDGSYTTKQDYPEAQRGTVIPSTPFAKYTIGVDYTFKNGFYLNFQYVHGFIDEFGAGRQGYAKAGAAVGDAPRLEERIGEYLVPTLQMKFFSDQVLVQLAGAIKIPSILDVEKKSCAVVNPLVEWAVWDATSLALGAFIFIGDHDTKFGDPAAGASEIYAKAKFTY